MAPKRLKEDPPPATTSSGEEEEEESENEAVSEEEEEKEKSENEEEEKEEEEEEEDDDGEEEEEEDEQKSPVGKPTVTPTKDQALSGSETESGSGTDSESGSGSDPKSPPSPSASAFTIKPIASKPMAHGPLKPTKANNNAPITVSGSSKRAAESDTDKSKVSKKRKVISSSSTTATATNGDDEDPKKASGPGTGAIPRLWGEEDELTVLKGMIEYGSKTGSDPYSDMGVFHEFIKKSLRVEVSKSQLMDKIRRMKKKYQTNFNKGGYIMVLKPHERKSFELSKKIWGSQTTPKPKTNPKAVTVALPSQEVVMNGGGVEGFWEGYPCLRAALETTAEMGFPGLSGLGTGTRFVRELMASIGSGKLKQMEDKCKEVRMAQLEVYVKRMELVHELGEVVLEAMKRR